MKKVFAFVLAILMVPFSAYAICIRDYIPDIDNWSEQDISDLIGELETIIKPEETTGAVIEDENVYIEVTGVRIDLGRIAIDVTVYNKTNVEMAIENKTTELNGWSISAHAPYSDDRVNIPPAGKIRGTLMFYDGVKMAGISSEDEIETLDISFDVLRHGFDRYNIGSVTFVR